MSIVKEIAANYGVPDLVLQRLHFENPWWLGMPGKEIQNLPERLYLEPFMTLLQVKDVHRLILLMGPRRVGKTVLMHHAIARLIRSGVSPRKIAYVSIENPLLTNISPDRLFACIRDAVGDADTTGWYIFFDEVQYLPEWEIHLKVLTDSYRKVRFVASGSAAAALKMKSLESGAGRFTDFMLPPLMFHEYLALKSKDFLLKPSKLELEATRGPVFDSTDLRTLNREFVEYINYGGYPEVIFSDSARHDADRYIRGDIIDKVLLSDLPALYGIENTRELNRLFATLVYNSGGELSYESLSNSSGLNKKTLVNYLTYFEAAFLIKIVHRVDDTARRYKRADLFKVYLTNPSLRTALFAPLEPTDDDMGNIVETALFSQWLHREWKTPHYARWTKGRFQGEVDMVGLGRAQLKPRWAVEIKWSNHYAAHPGKLVSLLNFCATNKLQSALVTTIDVFRAIQHGDVQLHFIPASLYAYSVGKNTLEQPPSYFRER